MTILPLHNTHKTHVGVAGVGAIGGAVCKALQEDAVPGMTLSCIAETAQRPSIAAPNMGFEELCARVDLVIECLPPNAAPALAKTAFAQGKDLILISASALLLYPEILDWHRRSKSRLIVPSGALAGLDGVKGLKELGLTSASIKTTKRPGGFAGAPYIKAQNIDLSRVTKKERLFRGNALEAAKGFPANVNVAATLSLAGNGPEETRVEIWADPEIDGNTHEIEVRSRYSTMQVKITNAPDPDNPKTSLLAAQSIIRILKDQKSALVVL